MATSLGKPRSARHTHESHCMSLVYPSSYPVSTLFLISELSSCFCQYIFSLEFLTPQSSNQNPVVSLNFSCRLTVSGKTSLIILAHIDLLLPRFYYICNSSKTIQYRGQHLFVCGIISTSVPKCRCFSVSRMLSAPLTLTSFCPCYNLIREVFLLHIS